MKRGNERMKNGISKNKAGGKGYYHYDEWIMARTWVSRRLSKLVVQRMNEEWPKYENEKNLGGARLRATIISAAWGFLNSQEAPVRDRSWKWESESVEDQHEERWGWKWEKVNDNSNLPYLALDPESRGEGSGDRKRIFYAKHNASPIEHKSTWRTLHFGFVSLNKTKFCSAWAAPLKRA